MDDGSYRDRSLVTRKSLGSLSTSPGRDLSLTDGEEEWGGGVYVCDGQSPRTLGSYLTYRSPQS